MKHSILLILLGGTLLAYGGTGTNTSSAVATHKFQVTWELPTNQWPDKLWTYRVVPQFFSEAVVSNLLRYTGFTVADRRSGKGFTDANVDVMLFGKRDGRAKYLAICPALGFVEYHDGKAKAVSQLETVTNVPDEKEVTKLGLDCLRLLGIDRDQLSVKPGTDELNLHWERQRLDYTDTNTQSEVTLTNAYGVFFLRLVDGYDTVGIGLSGGAYMSFGNNGKPVDIQVSWRNLQPYHLNQCPSPAELATRLKTGTIIIRSLENSAPFQGNLQKLSITKMSILYDAKQYDEPTEYEEPLGRFEAVAEDGRTKTPVWFEMPLTEHR